MTSWPRPFSRAAVRSRAVWISGSIGRPEGVSDDQAMRSLPGERVISSAYGRSLAGAG